MFFTLVCIAVSLFGVEGQSAVSGSVSDACRFDNGKCIYNIQLAHSGTCAPIGEGKLTTNTVTDKDFNEVKLRLAAVEKSLENGQQAVLNSLQAENNNLKLELQQSKTNHQAAQTENKYLKQELETQKNQSRDCKIELSVAKKELMNCTNELNNILGVSTNVLKSCRDYKTAGYHSGLFTIDPDGPGGMKPFFVTCDMYGKNGKVRTVIHHNEENLFNIPCIGRKCHWLNIIYNATRNQINAVKDASSSCDQFMQFDCYDTYLFYNHYNSWYSWQLQEMFYWGGSSPDIGGCACKVTNSCASNLGCNCDMYDKRWSQDNGLLTNKTILPVTKMKLGRTNYGVGYTTLGPLMCYE